MKVTVNRILTTKGINLTEQEVVEKLNSMTNNDFLVVELKQVVPNMVEAEDIFSLNFRLQGHDSAITQKAERTLITWINYSKQAFEKISLKVGQEIEGYTLEEQYLTINDLSTVWGIDTLDNLTQEPIVNPQKNTIMIYESEFKGVKVHSPMFRKVIAKKGAYTLTPKPIAIDTIPDFTGSKKVNGKKTAEYQQFLNKLKKQYEVGFTHIEEPQAVSATF